MPGKSKSNAKPADNLTKPSKRNAIEMIEGVVADEDLDQASGGKHVAGVKYEDITINGGTSTIKISQS